MSNSAKSNDSDAAKTELKRSAEKALEMKRKAGPQTNIPEHETPHGGEVTGSQVNDTDASLGKQATYTANLKRSHNARSGDAG